MKATDVTNNNTTTQLSEHLGRPGMRRDRVYLEDEPSAHWSGTSPLSPAYNKLFSELVPSSGPAKTIEGELIRAISKIIYRHYNDGDVFSQGSFDLITQAVGNFSSYDEMADKVIQYVLDKNGQYTPNGGIDWLDSADYGPDDEDEDEDDDYNGEYEDDWDDEDDDLREEGEKAPRARKPLTAKQKMAQVAKEGLISADSIRGKGPNTYIFRRGYYYRHGMDDKQFAERVSQELTALGINHKLVDSGDKWAPFKGGASLASQSHFWAVFTVSDEPIAEGKLTDPELIRARNKASTQYPNYDKDTAMLKYLQKGVKDGEENEKKNKKEHDKFEKEIKANKKEHDKFEKEIEKVSKKVDEAVLPGGEGSRPGGYPAMITNSALAIHREAAILMQKQVNKYKKYEAGTDTIPAGPDTSKFRATRSGMIEYAPKTTVHGGTYGFDRFYQQFVKIGGLVDRSIREKMEQEFKNWLVKYTGDPKVSYITPDGYHVRMGDVDGTNWGGYGLEFDKLSDSQVAHYKSTMSKIVSEGANAESDVANAVVAEVMKLIGEGHTEVSPDVITTKVSAAIGKPFMLKDLVAANNSSPALQHYISSINPTKIKFSTDILTVKNEDPVKEKEKAQSGVASMASRAANRSRLGENFAPTLQNVASTVAKEKEQAQTQFITLANSAKVAKEKALSAKEKFEQLSQKLKTLKDRLNSPTGARVQQQQQKTVDFTNKRYGLNEGLSPAERRANRELWDKANNRGKVPSIDHERYTPIHGLEGPIRLRSGKVVYYDTQVGKYYDRDTDMYLSDEDYMAHDAGGKMNEARAKKTVIDQVRGILENGYGPVKFADGSMRCDTYTASAVTKVFDALNDTSKAKASDMMQTKAGFMKFADFAFKNVSSGIRENLDDAALEADYNTGHKKGTADKQAGKENNSAECISDRERKGYADGYKSLNENASSHYNSGYEAKKSGKGRQDNPYTEGSKAAHHWAQGWEHASDAKPKAKFTNTVNEDEFYPTKDDGGRGAKSAQKWTEDDMWSLQNNLVDIDGLQDFYISGLSYYPKDNKYVAMMKPYEPAGKRKYIEVNFDIDSGGGSHYPVDVEFDRLYGDSVYLGGFNDREEFVQEGWESGPEERSPSVDRSDWDYEQALQDKLDAKADAQPKKETYYLLGRGPNMESNWDFGLGEFDSIEDAKAERDKLMADPSTPNPGMISIHTVRRTLKEWAGQPTLPLRSKEDYLAKRKALTDIQQDPDTAKDPMLKNEVVRRLMALQKQWEELQAKETELAEDILKLAGLKK